MCFEKTTGMKYGGAASYNDKDYGPTDRQRDRASGYQPTGVPSNMPAPSPVRRGIQDVFGDVDVGRTVGTGDNERLAKDPDNPYQNFMNNFRDSTGQGINRLAGGIKPLPLALFDAFRKSGKNKTVNMTDATDRLSGQIFRQAAANPGSITLSEDGLGLNIDTGTGTLKLGSSGFATYTGMPNENYEGVFDDLVNPNKKRGVSNDDGDDSSDSKAPFDPCPDGFKYNAETQQCEPVETTDDTEVEDKPKFTRNPTPISGVFPDLTRYGREGGEYQFFASMPGVPDPKLAEGGPPRGPQGEVKGPGGPKDDLVGPFMLSSKEYVLPYEMVLDEGNGNYNQGIKSLEQQRMAALKKYKARAASA